MIGESGSGGRETQTPDAEKSLFLICPKKCLKLIFSTSKSTLMNDLTHALTKVPLNPTSFMTWKQEIIILQSAQDG